MMQWSSSSVQKSLPLAQAPLRKPAEILAEMEKLDKETEAVLGEIKGLL